MLVGTHTLNSSPKDDAGHIGILLSNMPIASFCASKSRNIFTLRLLDTDRTAHGAEEKRLQVLNASRNVSGLQMWPRSLQMVYSVFCNNNIYIRTHFL